MSHLNENQHSFIQSRLKTILAITVIVSIVLRLTAPGYLLFYGGLFLLLAILVHIGVHRYSILQIDPLRAIHIYPILVSHLAFFLTFVFQADGADSPQVSVPILFWMKLTWNSPWLDISSKIVSISALILLLSWVILLGVSDFHKIKRRQPKSGVGVQTLQNGHDEGKHAK